jgi:YVTN family beta-propeller protein
MTDPSLRRGLELPAVGPAYDPPDGVTTIPLGGLAMGGMSMAPDGSRVYVGMNLETVPPPGFVSVIDTFTATVVENMGSLNVVADLVVAPDGNRLYVTDGWSLSTFDTGSYQLIAQITERDIGIGFGVIAIAPDGRHVYIAASGDVVYAVDTTSYTVDASTIVHEGPLDGPMRIAVTPDGSRLYVADATMLFVIDTASFGVVATITGDGADMLGVAMTPDGGHAFVAASSSAQSILVINTATDQVIHTIPNVDAQDLVVTPDGRFLLVTGTSKVSVIDTTAYLVRPTTFQAGELPSHPAVANESLYVVNVNPRTVSVVGIEGL